MPKPTFFNLPEKKSCAIINAAINEFSDNDYEAASIASIVENSGIARGSFYQYFENKEDLYSYLLDIVFAERLKSVTQEHESESWTVSNDMIERLIEQGLQYDNSNPRYSKLMNRAMFGNHSVREIAVKRIKEVTLSRTRNVIQSGIKSGYFRSDIDIDIATYILNFIMSDVVNYLHDYFPGMNDIEDDINRQQITEKRMKEQFYKIADILNYGLKNKERA